MFSLYFTALKSLAIKETNRYLRIWVQTLVPPVITTSLYFVIFGKMIGGRIGDMGGFSYMEFIVPGLIMMSVITSSYSNVSSSFFSQKFQKNIEEILVAPVPTHVIIWGFVIGGLGRSILVGALVTMISLFFVPLNVFSWGIVIVTLLMTSIIHLVLFVEFIITLFSHFVNKFLVIFSIIFKLSVNSKIDFYTLLR